MGQAEPDALTIAIFGHGSTHDYVAHVSISTFLRDESTSTWTLYRFGEPSSRILAREWCSYFKWVEHVDPEKVGEIWKVDELRKHLPGGRTRLVSVLTPHSLLISELNHVYLLDVVTQKVSVLEGSLPIRFTAEPCDES